MSFRRLRQAQLIPKFLSSTSNLRIPLIRSTAASYHHSATSMSDFTPIFTKDACPPAGPYSQAIRTPTQIYCSGQIPADASGTLITGSITDKTRACIKNLEAILKEGGSSIRQVVKVNVFLVDMGDFAEMNAEYEKWFSHKPARSCVAVHQLPKGVNVEIECIALL